MGLWLIHDMMAFRSGNIYCNDPSRTHIEDDNHINRERESSTYLDFISTGQRQVS